MQRFRLWLRRLMPTAGILVFAILMAGSATLASTMFLCACDPIIDLGGDDDSGADATGDDSDGVDGGNENGDTSDGNGDGTDGPGTDGGGGLDPNAPPVVDGDWYRPTVDTTWQWQLQPGSDGNLNTGYDVDVYDIDLFDTPTSVIAAIQAEGRFVLCYFSAGTYEDFRDDAGAFDESAIGNPLGDFPDERWLDVRSENVHGIMLDRLAVAVEKGCDGVEPDNVDGFANDSGFDFTAEDQLAFNRFIANAAHGLGLAVALKNDLDQIVDLVEYYDLAVNEECHEFDECDALQPFIDAGKPVFNAEYADEFVNDESAREGLCEAALAENLRTLVLAIDLDDSFRFSCEP